MNKCSRIGISIIVMSISIMCLNGDVEGLDREDTILDIQEESLKLRVKNESYSSKDLDKLYREKIEKDKIRAANQRIMIEKHKKIAEERKKREEAERKKKEAEKKKKEAERKKKEAEKKKREAEIKKAEQETVNQEVVYGANTIGINGIFKSFVSLGASTNTNNIQSYLNGGNIVSSLTYFNSNDNQTTYFSGHNPGIFNYMAQNMYSGAIVTVVNANGIPTNYKAIEGVYVDTNGSSVISSIGQTVRHVYNHGSGEESIVIQYCISGTMLAWYCTKV